MKHIQIENEEIKVSAFADITIHYTRKPKDSTKILLELINALAKFITELIYQNQCPICIPKTVRGKRGNNPIHISLQINKIPCNEPNRRN